MTPAEVHAEALAVLRIVETFGTNVRVLRTTQRIKDRVRQLAGDRWA